ncbi:MAG: ABC transporter permease [Acidobacteria bacterium]|nr:ABC transporter permease [Acidobacteriota bacterium]
MRIHRRWRRWRGDEADLRAELESHVVLERERLREAGFDADEAERMARASFGNVTQTEEDVHEAWGWAGVDRLMDDVRFGLRLLKKTPLWTLTVCSTLALGTGMGAAIFSVVYAVLLAPLPYAEPERVVAISPTASQTKRETFRANPMLWKHWKETLSSMEDVAFTRQVANFNLTGDGTPERLQGARFTHNVTRVLGVQPLLGRGFTKEEELGDGKVVLLSHRLWVRRFGADRGVVGRRIPLNGVMHEVVGVMPETFQYPDATFEIWAPLYLPGYEFGHGFNYGNLCTGRLKRGATIEQAQQELDGVMRRLAEEFPDAYRAGNEWIGGLVEPLGRYQAAGVRDILIVLSGAVGCLLAIGCMNLAVLLIARANGRAKEITVRAALGASRARLQRQMLAEAIPIGLLGGLGGIGVGYVFLQMLIAMLPASFPQIGAIGLHGQALAFAVLCSLGVVIAASVLPAQVASKGLLVGLQQHSRSVAAGSRVRDALVIGQVAMAVLLVFGGLLFARSLGALLEVNPGFSADTLTMHLAVSRAKYKDDAAVADYYRRLAARIKSIPGVREAGFVNRLPMSGLAQTGGVEFEGRDVFVMVDWRSATAGYFGAMGIPVLRGRNFTDGDRGDTAPVGLIDAALAQRVFGSEDPIGKRFRRSAAPGQKNDLPWSEIIGVVGHVRNDNMELDARAQAYWPETQRAQDRGALVVRTAGAASNFVKAIVGEIHAENPDQPVYDILTMGEWMGRSLQTRRLTTGLVSLFGLASVSLACLGLYGVISYAVGLRLREFGIRLAPGGARGVGGRTGVGASGTIGGGWDWRGGSAVLAAEPRVEQLSLRDWGNGYGVLGGCALCVAGSGVGGGIEPGVTGDEGGSGTDFAV